MRPRIYLSPFHLLWLLVTTKSGGYPYADIAFAPVSPTGPKSKLSNGRTVTNLASYNFYALSTNPHLQERAIQILRTYGVGPCSPPGFYGTQDVHIKTEADIASHLGTQACIVYAQAFSTISSVIPAFSKRGDIIVADKAVNYAIRKGIQISRSSVRWYEHNDMEDLERVLKAVVKEQQGRQLTRRFIVTEGLFENVGDMLDLPRVVRPLSPPFSFPRFLPTTTLTNLQIALKHAHKFRLILDESLSFGTLGRTARGLTEHASVDPMNVDMIVGSLAGPLCAGGGFCAGAAEIVEHQRISALAYTFSAALPAMLATTASEVLAMLASPPGSGGRGGREELLAGVRENVKIMWTQLDPRSEWVRCTSCVENPVMVLVLKDEVCLARKWGYREQEAVLQDVVEEALLQGVMVTRVKSMPRALGEREGGKKGGDAGGGGWECQPALKVCVTGGLSRKEIERAGVVVRHAVTKVVKGRK